MGVPALGVRYAQPAEKLRQLSIPSWPYDHMPVIRHDSISQEAHRLPFESLLKHLLECDVVALLPQQRGTCHRSIQDMVDIAARHSSWSPWHDYMPNERTAVVKQK